MAALNTYPRWKYILLLVTLLLGLLYSLPNIYGEDPAIQIMQEGEDIFPPNWLEKVNATLQADHIEPKKLEYTDGNLLVRFKNMDDQLKAQDALIATLPSDAVVAINLAPATPRWLQAIHAHPLKLGLDLRGGVHFLMEVEVESTIKRRMEGFLSDIRTELRQEKQPYQKLDMLPSGDIQLLFDSRRNRDEALSTLKYRFPEFDFLKIEEDDYGILVCLSPATLQQLKNDIVEQTITILRNRINELGVAESVVQRQGLNRIVVELPGVQDTARAKEILGKTATLEFVMKDEEHDPQTLGGRVPVGSRLVAHADGRTILVKKRVILTGNSITSAMAGVDNRDGMPTVNVRVGGGGLSLFKKITRENIGKQMAVIYVETKMENHIQNGQVVKTPKIMEKIISLATIQSALGSQFQITGLSRKESQDLALLLRSGALPAAVSIVEERTVGPTMGQDNIRLGMISMAVGVGAVLLFMAAYYSTMGIIADLSLIMNTLLLVALQSVIGATLTLPGIAGIVLTMGMAVDANVLIFERIREELRQGASIQASIHSGFEKAFATILDSNLTTLIAAVILFSIGTGPIRGFAVTLTLGLLTSLLTMVTGARAMVNLMYGQKSLKKLPVGI